MRRRKATVGDGPVRRRLEPANRRHDIGYAAQAAALHHLRTRGEAHGHVRTEAVQSPRATRLEAHPSAQTKSPAPFVEKGPCNLKQGLLFRSMGTHKHFKKEAREIRGTCVSCNERPQRADGRGGYKPVCRMCAGGGAEDAKRLAELRAIIKEHKANGSCVDCGEKDPIVLDFDHRDPRRKKFNISATRRRHPTVALLKAEIAKCDLRCANCHRRRTYRESHASHINKKPGAK